MERYSADRLKLQLTGRGQHQWEWQVLLDGGKPIRSGRLVGARIRAKAEGRAAMEELTAFDMD
ncbi:hypothetical protein ASD52_26430 [Ensifer sp. Root142]|nr:hypothetical protein ASD52_26430 [Ensifer sp. Root142]